LIIPIVYGVQSTQISMVEEIVERGMGRVYVAMSSVEE